MAQVIPNQFTSYKLNEQEQLEGSKLTVTQKQVIRNLLSDTATAKVNLEYDAEHSMDFIQQEAYHKGQLEAYQFLLDASQASEEVTSNQ